MITNCKDIAIDAIYAIHLIMAWVAWAAAPAAKMVLEYSWQLGQQQQLEHFQMQSSLIFRIL